MKNRIIALLLGILLGIGIWLYGQLILKEQKEKEIKKIINEMNEIEYKKKEFYIKKQKEKVLSYINTDKNNYSNYKQYSNIKIIIYNYDKLYKKIYDTIINNKNVKDKIGYKNFKNTKLYKRLIDIKSNNIHTKIIYKGGKEINYDYIPIDIDCKGYCKKQINKNLNNLYKLDKSILQQIEYNKTLTNKEIINFIKSDLTMFQYFNKNK